MQAVEIYCEAVTSLTDDLTGSGASSRGLRDLSDYLSQYVASKRFIALVEEAADLTEALSRIRYLMRIEGLRVTVGRYEDEADYSLAVRETFARFRQGAAKSYLVGLPHQLEVNDTEVKILELVARLHPEPFTQRADYCARHRDFADETITKFDREVQFYIGYLDLIGPLRASGLPFCYPRVSPGSKEINATGTFDLALANKLATENREVVCNDFCLSEPERLLVVSGPNNGGKTTFARTFGQLHYLASLGLPVPGSDASLVLPDQIFTHFEREENIETLRGKFEQELVRVHEILEQATSSSVIVMNESFNSTTLHDALFVGTEVVSRLLDRGCVGVYVTFVEEIASVSEATVSMVSEVVPENPAHRTFRVLRKPADGLAYAWAIAEKYGLTYERLMERIGA
jgi:DNA mismatch repair ATPase MutS